MSAPPPDDDLVSACAGPRRRFNWAAALLPFWLSWRRLHGWQLLAVLLFFILDAILTVQLQAAAERGQLGLKPHDERPVFWSMAMAYVALGLAEGFLADALLRLRAGRLLRRLRAAQADHARAMEVMRREGRGSRGGAFAMGLGLLILPAWVPQIFTANRGLERKAYRAAMKSDLRNLVTAQETYSSEQGGFTARPEDPAPRGVAYRAGPGVTVTMGIVSPTGWNAIARHEQSRETCGVRVGAASSPLDTVGAEGEPVCGRPGRRRE